MDRRLLLPLLAAVLALAACGGDDRLSRDEYIARADEICADIEQRGEALQEPESVEDVRRFIDQARPLLQEGIDDLRALEPPEDLQGPHDSMVDAAAGGLPALDRLAEAAEQEDEEAFNAAVEEITRADEESSRIAGEMGMKACAESD